MLRAQETRIERDGVPPPLVAVDDAVADVEGKRHRARVFEDAPHLGERLRQLLVVEIDDRIEGDYAGERRAAERQLEHVAHDELDPGEEAPCLGDHRHSDVEPPDLEATMGEIGSHVAGPTAQLYDQVAGGRVQPACELSQPPTVEWLVV